MHRATLEPTRRRRRRRLMVAAGRSREPAYFAYLAIAVGSLWAYAWSDAFTTSAHVAPERRSPRATPIVDRQPHRVVNLLARDRRW